MKVRANAETPLDARTARQFGAEGIGLCRTEHMFFEGDRIVAVREMILADDEKGRRARARQAAADAARRLRRALRRSWRPAGHHPPARSAAARVPAAHATRRSPRSPRAMGASARTSCARAPPSCTSSTRCSASAAAASAIAYPEIAEMQARAIFEAAVEAGEGDRRAGDARDHGAAGRRPSRSSTSSRRASSPWREAVAKETGDEARLPGRHHDRAAARRRSAPTRSPRRAEFFSFGTNDLTQTDARHLAATTRRRSSAPTRQRASCRRSLRDARHRRRRRARQHRPSSAAAATRPDIKLGICGEHGGDPASIAFCEQVGPRLRLLLALPRADRPPRGGAGGARGEGRQPGLDRLRRQAEGRVRKGPAFML